MVHLYRACSYVRMACGKESGSLRVKRIPLPNISDNDEFSDVWLNSGGQEMPRSY